MPTTGSNSLFPNVWSKCRKWHRENAVPDGFHHQLVSASDLYARCRVLVTERVIFREHVSSALIETGQ
jgi:hypothetical protein